MGWDDMMLGYDCSHCVFHVSRSCTKGLTTVEEIKRMIPNQQDTKRGNVGKVEG